MADVTHVGTYLVGPACLQHTLHKRGIAVAFQHPIMGDGWLADIAAVYAMISFLAVVVLTKIYIGVYREKHSKEDQKS